MTQIPQERTEDLQGRVRTAVDGWKRKLLDLSGRNRALNFKPTKVSTITIVDEQPSEVFRRLYLEEQPMRFKAAPEPEKEPKRPLPSSLEAADSTLVEEEAEEDTPDIDFVPYDPSSLDDRHRDGFLQTASTTDLLDKSLRRIDEQSRASLEELGVNTLFLTLGMLHYKESTDSEIVLKAPLILLPVQLDRKTARAGYAVAAADDEPMVNPALREYLKRNFGLALPELPASDLMPDSYDLQGLFEAVRQLVAGQPAWAVKTDMFVGLFSFQKFVMYKDLEANGEAFVLHRLINRLVVRQGGAVVGMPSEIRSMNLDESFPPETTSQVVDADSSQLRALAAAARGHDVVIEGPPGTGKSQTITNLIAQALAADKSVLFVAEKMAALQVVHSRLVQAGLGEFCLELHSTKAQKRRVIQGLAAALDASLQPVAAPTSSIQRLPQVRFSLNEYATALHTHSGSLNLTPYRAYGELGTVLGAPRVQWRGDSQNVTPDQLEATMRALRDFASHAEHVGDLAAHPWRDATKTFYSPTVLETIEDSAAAVLVAIDATVAQAAIASADLHFPPIETIAAVETVVAVAEAMAASPGAPADVLVSDAWNSAPAEATTTIAQLRALKILREDLNSRLRETAFDRDHGDDASYVEERVRGFWGFLAIFSGRYRAVRNRWKTYSRSDDKRMLADEIADLRSVDRYRADREALEKLRAHAITLFGSLWLGESSDADGLDRYVAWVIAFRQLCLTHHLPEPTARLASQSHRDVSVVRALASCCDRTRSAIDELTIAVGWPEKLLSALPFTKIAERVGRLKQSIALGPQWAALEETRQGVAKGLAADLLVPVFAGQLGGRDLPSAFRRAFLMQWLSTVVEGRPALAKFHSLTHDERVSEFRALDMRVLLENRAGLIGQLRDRVQDKLSEPAVAAALPSLQREMAKQRNLSPLRKTLRESEPAIRAIKPCFLMSPLTVAQYIRGGTPAFDLVIFDEASQLPSEDAVGAIVRAKQLVVVGDPKQLPPTTFFSSSLELNELYAPDGTPVYQDAESVLEEFMGAGLPMSRLKWHYRSAHESLITFSNVSFYDADLHTFPSVHIGVERHGLSFEFVEGATYEGKGLNLVEARRVADEVVSFARQQLERRQAGENMLSVGVGTFNLRQQIAIQDELESRRRADPSIEPFFDRGLDEPFVVKNLESIQGDERDVILISVTYARALDGQLRYQFGPLNGQNGWRRLNVLTTRARRQMRVFSSMHGDDISPAATASDGPRLLREFLLYAEHGRLVSKTASNLAHAESPFEREVIGELTRRGINAVPQIGSAGYRIDIGVLDEKVPGRFICGIECDGVAYHSSESARDRDRLRHQVLEGRGWNLIRVWSTDWFKDRSGQIERLVKAIDSARSLAQNELQIEREARRAVAQGALANNAATAPMSDSHSHAVSETEAEVSRSLYRRPAADSYVVTPGEGQFKHTEILEAADSAIAAAIQKVVDIEAPLHVSDLMTRIASMWGTKAGSRVQLRILNAASQLINRGTVRRRGDFVWGASDSCSVRSRATTKISADRIAPEEFEQAILAVLASGHSFVRPQLTVEVRSILGYSRTGAIIEDAVSDAIARLLEAGRIGEGSGGVRLRN